MRRLRCETCDSRLAFAALIIDHAPSFIHITYPFWVDDAVDWDERYESDGEKMLLAIEVARRNVLEQTGGPFGAAVFESASGRLLSVGMNMVVSQNNAMLHGEVVAFMMAQARLRSYTLGGPGQPEHELVTSCDPCAMCLGATLWSGVRRVICGARREDAELLDFDEGPVFPESYAYLRSRGIEIVRGVRREQAAAVLEFYRNQNGTVYNG